MAKLLTQTGLVMGTMSYCAPEQFRDASHVDIRADIYSLGCTLYHLLTGNAPYWQRKTFAEVVQAHLHEPFPLLAESRSDAPASLEKVLARMTAKDRDLRYSTPREVAEVLEPFAQAADLKSLVPARTQQRPPRRVTTGKATPTPEGRIAESGGRQSKAGLSRRAALFFGVPTAVGAAYFLGKRATREDPVKKSDKWQVLYDLLDDKLACFMGYVGRVSPSTKFLIYSRGTDKNWVTDGFQEKWVAEIEARFPELKDRISTMEIKTPPGRKHASFRHPETAEVMKTHQTHPRPS